MRSLLAPLMFGLAGCGAAAAAEHSIAPPPGFEAEGVRPGYRAGESMRFEVKLGALVAGEAALAVGEPGMVDGRPAIAIRSRIASAGAFAMIKNIVDEATTMVDTETARPLTVTADYSFGKKSYHANAEFDGAKVKLEVTKSDSPTPVLQRFHFGDVVAYDAHTSMALVRTWDATQGTTRTIWALGGRRMWRTDIKMVGRETIGTQVGNRPAIILDGTAYRLRANRVVDSAKKPRQFRIWLSDDADRVPLRVKTDSDFGDIVIELVEYQRP